jgi:hypothetical protein
MKRKGRKARKKKRKIIVEMKNGRVEGSAERKIRNGDKKKEQGANKKRLKTKNGRGGKIGHLS